MRHILALVLLAGALIMPSACQSGSFSQPTITSSGTATPRPTRALATATAKVQEHGDERIVYIHQSAEEPGRFMLRSIMLDGNDDRLLIQPACETGACEITSLAASPDGQWIAYAVGFAPGALFLARSDCKAAVLVRGLASSLPL